ncbi:alpha/beta fold hydrolase [Dichotomicrobium thermohalophilum]|uniref:Pimeloyl-ACP methyl ester carboxylesterase n=1 Tax=Dichotomicrobium thermohalophilum TaxID=933063 RepID=A0A397Q1X8_9HYPH|nr:alpha/beta hydrolase [Dichotomicrobium thermohalophilum]RIA55058.1 pimeloyl-ACP methyl ester carboxylesterase [Dichotomicrobium thermohalophilum]
MVNLTPESTLIGGYRIACGVRGDGPPVILLHGTPSFSYIWRNVAPRLAERYRVHLFDLLGFGHSERPADPAVDTSVAAQMPVLTALMDHWGLSDAHIVAHNIGGAVAQRFGIVLRDRVRSLTLIDTVSFDSWPSPRTRQQMQGGLEKLIRAPEAQHRAHFRNWLESAVADVDSFHKGALDVYLDMISGPVGQASFFQHQVAHYDPRYTQEIADRVWELGSKPVQLIWGETDTWQAVDWAYKLRETILDSELYILPACGHFAMEDRPEDVAQLVTDFIARHEHGAD